LAGPAALDREEEQTQVTPWSVIPDEYGDFLIAIYEEWVRHDVGNITINSLNEMMEKSLRSGFGVTKESALPRWCRECDVLGACHGGCPKQRFAKSYYDEPGLNFLCPGYKKFFVHIPKYLRAITQLLENGLPAFHVMKAIDGPLVIKMDKKNKMVDLS